MNTQGKNNELFFWLIASASILAGYLAGFVDQKPIFYSLMLGLCLMSPIGMWFASGTNKLPGEYVLPVYVCVILSLLWGAITGGFSMIYVDLFFLISTFCFSYCASLSISRLLYVSNSIFSLYLFLSLLLYLDLLSTGRDLNIFENDRLEMIGGSFKTFVGFYGSTAAIDSYAVIIAVINFLFNKSSVSRLFFVIAGVASAAATLRFTPFISIAGMATVIVILKMCRGPVSRSIFLTSLSVLILSSPFLLVVLNLYLGFGLTEMLAVATSGRAVIWDAMLYNYLSSSTTLVTQLFGTGDASAIAVDLGFSDGHLVANPHNNYLSFFLKYGVIGWAFLFICFTKVILTFREWRFIAVTVLIMLTAITNNETFGIYYPLYIFWVGAFYARSRSESFVSGSYE